MNVSNEKLQELITLARTERQIFKKHTNVGEPWDSFNKFMDKNLVELLEELLWYRETFKYSKAVDWGHDANKKP